MLIERDRSLQSLNTFGIAVRARRFAEIRTPDDLQALRDDPEWRADRCFILGGGSNVLFRSDLEVLVLKNSIPGIDMLDETADHVRVRVGAGEVWHDFVRVCVDRNWAGLENLSLIPGQVGAAPIQNIGAYGAEMKSTCESVEAIELATGARVTFSNRDCEFGYRDSVFKHRHRDRFMITAVTFRLSKTPQFNVSYGDVQRTLEKMQVETLTLRAVSDAIIRIRQAKLPDPRDIGNAGSFFKNPVVPQAQWEALAAAHPGMPHYAQPDGSVKLPAAWLIERCGWKGVTRGQAGVHDRQALVLVNRGGATGDEILRLAEDIQKSVRDQFGIDLVREVQVV